MLGLNKKTTQLNPTKAASASPSKAADLWRKRLPAVAGLAVLVVSLVIGLIFFSQGTGVFAPRATPETTPKEVQISNVSDRGFVVSFLTMEKTPGFIKYGESPDKLDLQVGDERDQLTGSVGEYQVHYISVSGLKPNTTYYFTLGTGSRSAFDDNGQPFKVKTAKKASTPPAAKTIYGNVVTQAGTPAKEAIVFAKVEGAGLLSSLVKKSGSWVIPLSNARTVDGSGYAQITDESVLVLVAVSPTTTQPTTINTTVGEFESGSTITLGQSSNQPPKVSVTPSLSLTTTPSVSITPSASPSVTLTPSASPSATPSIGSTRSGARNGLGSLLSDTDNTASASATAAGTIKTQVDLEADEEQVVHTTQPEIKGKAKPKVKVKISIHSDNQIQTEVIADATGEFTVDIAALAQELEPGEHTIEYTYIDPDTGEEVTRVETFVVADPNASSNQLAQANTTSDTTYGNTTSSPTSTPTPTISTYGTDYPYNSQVTTPTSSPSASLSPTPTKTQTASPSSLPKAGAVSVTLLTILGGLFFILVGSWSFWIALELQKNP